MFKKLYLLAMATLISLVTGCASVNMEPPTVDIEHKKFLPPPEGKAALYIFRDSSIAPAIKKTITVNGKVIGESATKVYFYQVIDPGTTTIATESEFSDNSLVFDAAAGTNYFIRQYIRFGVFVAGANLEMVDEYTGKIAVRKTKLAKSNP